MKPMNSKQENVLRSLMNRSFGSPYLFIPQEYNKGSAKREPADLAWIKGNFVVLFYLQESQKSSITKQIQHNIGQANGFLRVWKQGNHTLIGINRFNQQTELKYNNDLKLIIVSIVSAECGISIIRHEDKKHLHGHITLNIPERLIHEIAHFGATIVDFLLITKDYLISHPIFLLSNQSAYKALKDTTITYYKKSTIINNNFLLGDGFREKTSSYIEKALADIYKPISKTKVKILREQLADKKELNDSDYDESNQNTLAEIFSDLSLAEYTHLAYFGTKIVELSEPPFFKKWNIITFKSYYRFSIFFTILAPKTMEKAFLELKKHHDEQTIMIGYGNLPTEYDYEQPYFFGIPTHLPPCHAEILYNDVLEIITTKYKI